jgi:hypothetical protein
LSAVAFPECRVPAMNVVSNNAKHIVVFCHPFARPFHLADPQTKRTAQGYTAFPCSRQRQKSSATQAMVRNCTK